MMRWIALGLHAGQQAREDNANREQGGEAKDALCGGAADARRRFLGVTEFAAEAERVLERT
jgi:hypothetical protein